MPRHERRPELELVVLVTDQEQTMDASVSRLREALQAHPPSAKTWRMILVDNGSTDGTAEVAERLARSFADVDFVVLPTRLGRKDLHARWADSPARTVAFLPLAPDADVQSQLAPVLEHATCRTRTSAIEQPAFRGLVDRRTALAAISGLGLAAVVTACSSGSSSSATTSAPRSTDGAGSSSTSAPSHQIALAPEMTDGPYYLDLDKVRSDITEDRKGARLALNLTISDVATGAPIKGAAVDIWHADAEGLYSGFVAQSAGANHTTSTSADDGTFLRGTQITDKVGGVHFATIYPGWYGGRAVHIHLKVHANGSVIHVGQLFFDDALTDAVFSSVAPYSERPARDVRNAADSIYAGGGNRSTLDVQKHDGRYQTSMVIGVKTA